MRSNQHLAEQRDDTWEDSKREVLHPIVGGITRLDALLSTHEFLVNYIILFGASQARSSQEWCDFLLLWFHHRLIVVAQISDRTFLAAWLVVDANALAVS